MHCKESSRIAVTRVLFLRREKLLHQTPKKVVNFSPDDDKTRNVHFIPDANEEVFRSQRITSVQFCFAI